MSLGIHILLHFSISEPDEFIAVTCRDPSGKMIAALIVPPGQEQCAASVGAAFEDRLPPVGFDQLIFYALRDRSFRFVRHQHLLRLIPARGQVAPLHEHRSASKSRTTPKASILLPFFIVTSFSFVDCLFCALLHFPRALSTECSSDRCSPQHAHMRLFAVPCRNANSRMLLFNTASLAL